jgi:ABC-2 type transport system permease protein
MSRYLAIFRLTARNSLIREMNFKLNFLLWMVVELLWFVGQLAFIEVLYGQVDDIAGWSKWQVVTLVGVHQIISQLFQAFFYLNLANLPELVRTGHLDHLLKLPMDAQFAVSTRQVSFDCVVNSLVGVGIVTFALVKLGTMPSIAQFALFALAVPFGVAVHYAVMLGLSCISFWFIRAQSFIYGYFNLFHIGRYPETVFRGVFRFIFTWLVPIILVSNVPAKILTRPLESPFASLAMLAAATVIVLAATRLLWRLGLRHYGSASS